MKLLLATAIALGAWAGARAEAVPAEQPEDARMAAPTAQMSATIPTPESATAPMPVGNAAKGKAAYVVCAVCHLESGAGRPDGVFPQLAGQFAEVTYRQIADIRDGRRTNPIMYPFAATLTNSQVLADLASYIESLPLPLDNGKGSGIDYAMGAELYKRDCGECHGDRGQGDREKLVPVIASQHFAYLVRQIDDIAGRHRENGNPAMAQIASGYSQRELEAVADFISRLEEAEQLVPVPAPAPE